MVASLARPGANITGFTDMDPAIAGKWVELLKMLVPRGRVANGSGVNATAALEPVVALAPERLPQPLAGRQK
jgi:hypothetical protein